MGNRKGKPSIQDRENMISNLCWVMGCNRDQALRGLTIIAMEVDVEFGKAVNAARAQDERNRQAALANEKWHRRWWRKIKESNAKG